MCIEKHNGTIAEPEPFFQTLEAGSSGSQLFFQTLENQDPTENAVLMSLPVPASARAHDPNSSNRRT
jgi:hypothetical protein